MNQNGDSFPLSGADATEFTNLATNGSTTLPLAQLPYAKPFNLSGSMTQHLPGGTTQTGSLTFEAQLTIGKQGDVCSSNGGASEPGFSRPASYSVPRGTTARGYVATATVRATGAVLAAKNEPLCPESWVGAVCLVIRSGVRGGTVVAHRIVTSSDGFDEVVNNCSIEGAKKLFPGLTVPVTTHGYSVGAVLYEFSRAELASGEIDRIGRTIWSHGKTSVTSANSAVTSAGFEVAWMCRGGALLVEEGSTVSSAHPAHFTVPLFKRKTGAISFNDEQATSCQPT